MHHSPFTPSIRRFGAALIALSLVACVPSGSDNGDNDGAEGPDDPMMTGDGGSDEGGQSMEPGGGDSTPAALGAACNIHRDCESGFCLAGLPGGYCTQACQESEDCGPTGSCWNMGGAQRLCLLNCDDSTDCREDDGYVCDRNNACAPASAGGGGGGGGGPGMGSSPGVPVGETVGDFALINCASGEEVNMRTYFADKRAGLFVLTAGWCGACAQWIPQVIGLMGQPQYEGLETAFVLGENSGRSEPTLRECEQYGRGHGVPPEKMFMDHNGTNAFRTVFAEMMLYTNEGGGFGLPWNAIIDPDGWEYIYSDGGPGGDLNSAFRTLLQ